MIRSDAASDPIDNRIAMTRPNPSDMAIDAFRFLLEQRDFLLANASDSMRESHVTFRSERVIVSVMIDGAPADVGVAILEVGTGKGLALATVVRASCPEELARLEARGPLADQLATAAALLRRCAADLLAGDFARLPALLREQAARGRERKQATFGTSTGESPRFATRPSLAALFADAAGNPGLREPRAYQAYWDYEYPLDAIAAFLEVTPGDVQAMLDRWDRL